MRKKFSIFDSRLRGNERKFIGAFDRAWWWLFFDLVHRFGTALLDMRSRESAQVRKHVDLALMNGEIAGAQAAQFAARVKKSAADKPEMFVETAWRLAFGRSPSPEERQTASDYLERNSLERLCLLIFNMSEFIYVD